MVRVVSAAKKYIGTYDSSWVRRWLASGEAIVVQKEPFTVMFIGSHIPAAAVRKGNFVDWFDDILENNRTVYVRNNNGKIVVVEVTNPRSGQKELLKGFERGIPPHKDPVRLPVPTSYLIDDSDFRNLCTMERPELGNRPILELMTPAEAALYFEKKAKARGLASAQQAESQAIQERKMLLSSDLVPAVSAPGTFLPPDSAAKGMLEAVKGPSPFEYKGSIADFEVHPKVKDLCQQVRVIQGEEPTMKVRQFTVELQAIDGLLKRADYEHIAAFGPPESRQWALAKIQQCAFPEESVDVPELYTQSGAEQPKMRSQNTLSNGRPRIEGLSDEDIEKAARMSRVAE